MTNTPYRERTQRVTSQVWQSQELAELPTRKPSSFPVLIFFIILGAGIAFAYALHGLTVSREAYGSWQSRLPLRSLLHLPSRWPISGIEL